MMNNTNDPMMELLRIIFGDSYTHEKSEEIPTETKDFGSLVSKEEYEAIKNLKVAFNNFVEVHNKEVIKASQVMDNDIYAKVQYLLLNDSIDDVKDGISKMYTIYTCDKKCIDELVELENLSSVEDFEKKLTTNQLMRKLRGCLSEMF